jgi:hypothetical protein
MGVSLESSLKCDRLLSLIPLSSLPASHTFLPYGVQALTISCEGRYPQVLMLHISRPFSNWAFTESLFFSLYVQREEILKRFSYPQKLHNPSGAILLGGILLVYKTTCCLP